MRYLMFEVLVPDWCNWVAQDKSGEWRAFRLRPTASPFISMWACRNEDRSIHLALGHPPKDWEKELYKVK